jgi:Mg/Co/Ni transporter MgtE
VFRYQAGKADWFAAGLPREGRDARTPRVGDVARRDVPTCRLEERTGAVRDRIRAQGFDVCVVVDENRVVLGIVSVGVLDVDPDTPVEAVIESSPVTFRPNQSVAQVPDYLKTRRPARALVTTSDGVLVGLLRADHLGDGHQRAEGNGG